jgi:hypothetical protein
MNSPKTLRGIAFFGKEYRLLLRRHFSRAGKGKLGGAVLKDGSGIGTREGQTIEDVG